MLMVLNHTVYQMRECLRISSVRTLPSSSSDFVALTELGIPKEDEPRLLTKYVMFSVALIFQSFQPVASCINGKEKLC